MAEPDRFEPTPRLGRIFPAADLMTGKPKKGENGTSRRCRKEISRCEPRFAQPIRRRAPGCCCSHAPELLQTRRPCMTAKHRLEFLLRVWLRGLLRIVEFRQNLASDKNVPCPQERVQGFEDVVTLRSSRSPSCSRRNFTYRRSWLRSIWSRNRRFCCAVKSRKNPRR